MFNLQLSISTKPTFDKDSAGKITQFEVKDVDPTELKLKEIFTKHVYSGNQWIDGKCKNLNFQRMTAVILDADQGLSIPQAQELFKDFHYIIHTSTSHLADIESKGGKQERFRIILPLAPVAYNNITTPDVAGEVYLYLFDQYTWADASCKDAARKYYPFLNKVYPDLFQLHIHEGKDYFAIDLTQIAARPKNAVAGLPKPPDEKYIYLNDEFFLRDGKTKVRLRNIKQHLSVYCIFCDDINSASGSAFIDINPNGKYFLFCQHCNKTYWIAPEDEKGEMFFLGSRLMKILTNDQTVTITQVSKDLFNDLPVEYRQVLLNRIAKYRTMPEGAFQLNYLADAYADTISYELDTINWDLRIHIPPLPVNKKDNAFIDSWLNDMFGEHADFIKNWMAVFCYTNYEKIATIILNGVRGSGKTTFGELMRDIFPKMGSDWSASGEDYTEFFQKKLLLVEENDDTDKKEQYTNIKKVSGSDLLTVNIKYGAKYQVKNNTNVIVLSNAPRPLFVVNQEQPVDENGNNFFMKTLRERPKKLNSNIKNDLRDRIGYYVRTELRTRFINWKNSHIKGDNRYSMPVPITEDLKYVYASSKTSIDEECEDIYDILTNGRSTVDNLGNPLRPFGPYPYVTYTELKEICNAFKFKQQPSSYKKHLQDNNWIERTESRAADKRIGYRVL